MKLKHDEDVLECGKSPEDIWRRLADVITNGEPIDDISLDDGTSINGDSSVDGASGDDTDNKPASIGSSVDNEERPNNEHRCSKTDLPTSFDDMMALLGPPNPNDHVRFQAWSGMIDLLTGEQEPVEGYAKLLKHLLSSVQKAFSTDGFLSLEVIAFGDFSKKGWAEGSNLLLCRDPDYFWGCRPMQSGDHRLWGLVEANMDFLAAFTFSN